MRTTTANNRNRAAEWDQHLPCTFCGSKRSAKRYTDNGDEVECIRSAKCLKRQARQLDEGLPRKVRNVRDGLERDGWTNVQVEVDGHPTRMYDIRATVCEDQVYNQVNVQVVMTATKAYSRTTSAVGSYQQHRTWQDFWSWSRIYGQRQQRSDERAAAATA